VSDNEDEQGEEEPMGDLIIYMGVSMGVFQNGWFISWKIL